MPTKPTGIYIQLSTLRRLAPHLTSLVGLDSLINRLCDAAGFGAADAYPPTTTRDAQALIVAAHLYDSRYDLNGDLFVTPGDQALAAALEMPQSAPASSSILDTIIRDMAPTPHDGPICGVAGYDWEHHAAIQQAQSGGIAAMTGWGWAQHFCGSPQDTATRVHVRNRKTWLWDGAAYTLVQSGAITWRGVMTTMTNAFAPGNEDWRDEGGGEYSFVVPPDTAVHWAGPNNAIPAGNFWILCMAEYKITGDLSALIMGECGADWRTPDAVGAVVGRGVRLTDQWQVVTACTFRPTVAPVYP